MSQLKKGAILSYMTIILTNVVGLVLTPFIIRSLGDAEYGLYTLIGAFVGYISVMDLGLNNTIVRYVSKYQAEKDKKGEEEFLGTSLIIYFFISILVLLVGLVLYWNIESIFNQSLTESELGKAKIMMLILIFNLMFSLPGGSFTAICNAYEKFVFPRVLNIIKYIFRSILVIVILLYGADSIGLVILDTVINLVAILITFIYVKTKLNVKYRFRKNNKNTIIEIFSYSIWIFLFAIIGQMQWQGGQFVIGIKLDTTQVAVYAVGILLGTYYGAFSGAVSSLFLPRATQMTVNKSTPKELTMTMVKVARFSLFTLILIFVGFLFLGKEFVRLWLGETYQDAYYIAIIVMIGYTVPLIQTFANSLLEAHKLFKFKALIYLGCLGIGTFISFLFVEKYGIIAVICCIVLGWLLAQVIMNVFFVKKIQLDIPLFLKKTAKGLLPVFILLSVLAYGIIQFSFFEGWLDFILKAGIIGLLYVGLLYFLGMNSEEKTTVLNLFKRYGRA